MFQHIVFWLGIWQMCIWLFRIVSFYFETFQGVQATTERYGKDSWAVVTGSSDGIGLAFAKNLAQRGFNIVLMARNLDKLNKCAADI